MILKTSLIAAAALALTACASQMGAKPMFSQDGLPDAVKVPAGHKVAMETVGVGEIFVGPDAKLMDRAGKQVGRYYGPPATWEAMDGSKFTGAQVAVAPAPAGNIPLQLVKANPAMGMGALQGVTYVQRVATVGGVAPAMACGASNTGSKQIVQYRADYILYKAG
jgi:hypothetical protein